MYLRKIQLIYQTKRQATMCQRSNNADNQQVINVGSGSFMKVTYCDLN